MSGRFEGQEKDEKTVLLEQLREILDNQNKDEDDAIELAVCAGLLVRMGHVVPELDEAKGWAKSSEGKELLKAAFEDLNLEGMQQALEDVLDGSASVEVVEEALFDFDDTVAAVVWAGQASLVRGISAKVAKMIRQSPEPFAPLSDYAKEIARSREVAMNFDVYDYLFAVADASQWVVDG